jgi:hypothetical protein
MDDDLGVDQLEGRRFQVSAERTIVLESGSQALLIWDPSEQGLAA